VPDTANVSKLNETPYTPNPFRTSATRRLQFCVPDEWFRRSKFRVAPSLAHQPSEETIKQLANLDEMEAVDEGEGTAKQKDAPRSPPAVSSPIQSFNPGTEWRGTVAQRRLSSLFETWKGSGDAGGSGTMGKKTVSEPQLLSLGANGATSGSHSSDAEDSSESELDPTEFEEMLASPSVLR
jgi:diaphanous 1